MAHNIIIVVLAVAVVVFIVIVVLGQLGAGEGAKRIADLEDTIGRLQANHQFLENSYSGLKESEQKLRENNERLTDAIGRLESGVGDAGDLICEALQTVERLEAIHNEIGN